MNSTEFRLRRIVITRIYLLGTKRVRQCALLAEEQFTHIAIVAPTRNRGLYTKFLVNVNKGLGLPWVPYKLLLTTFSTSSVANTPGETVYSVNINAVSEAIDLSHLPKGIYYLNGP